MVQILLKAVKWASIPVLLFASLFACCTAGYEPALDCVACLGAMVLVQRAIALREYFWAVGFLSIVVAFSPISLLLKLFFLMGFICLATLANLIAVFRKTTIASPSVETEAV
jgi:hypothetical protein